MVVGRRPAAGIGDLAGVFLGVVEELPQRRIRRILRHHHHHAVGAGDADGHKILQRLVVHLLRQRQDGEQRAADEQDGVAVARQVDRVVDADRAAGADLVLDDEGLAQLLLSRSAVSRAMVSVTPPTP